MRYRLAAQAQKDLRDIWNFVTERSGNSTTADNLLVHLTDVITLIAANPMAGRSRPELQAGLRSFPHERYLILYRLRARVEIVRIVQGSRDLNKLFND
jgi:toxin ParE1/3/4